MRVDGGSQPGDRLPGSPGTLTDLARRAGRLQDPRDGLRALVALRRQLDVLEELHVENAVRAGCSWGDVGAALGTTRQGAHKRHAARLKGMPAGQAEVPSERSRVLITGEARRCVARARHEAEALHEPALRTEHLLLGVLAEDGTLARRALDAVGVPLEAARRAVEPAAAARAVKAPASDRAEPLPISRLAREVLEQSLREAVRLGDAHLGAEHILAALLRPEQGGAARVLTALGVARARVERALDAVRGGEPSLPPG